MTSPATSNVKKSILIALAETCDFGLVKKKFPHIKESFIKEALLEASAFFNYDEEEPPLPLQQNALPLGMKLSSPLIINTDGASKGNPGMAGAGIVIKDSNGGTVAAIKKYLGVMTNNQAEYSALIIGLKEAARHDALAIKILMDSELIVKQIKGEYQVKNEELKVLNREALALLKKFKKYDISHVLRNENKLADTLANEAVSEHLSSERNR